MPWYNPITWIPTGKAKPAATGNGRPSATSVAPTEGEKRELAEIVPKMRGDYQVTFCERVLAANISAVKVTVAQEGASDYSLLVGKLQDLWDKTAPVMSDDIAYGRIAWELCWDAEGGYQFPRKLESFAFEDSRMKLDDGKFAGIEYRTKANEWECLAPINCWWQALDPTTKYPHGRSRFMTAPYNVWKDKDKAKDNRRTALSKWANRGPVWRGPTTIIDEKTQQVLDVMPLMMPALESWSKGGGLHLPNETLANDPTKWAWEIIEADLQGFNPGAANESIERYDVEMLRAFGIPEKTVTEGSSTGSYAMVSQQMLTLFAVVEDIARQRVESFQKYVIGKVEEVNGLTTGTINANFVPITNQPDAFVLKIIELLLANPMFVEGILGGGVDMRKVLEDAGLPVTEQLETLLRTAAQRMAAAQGASAGQAASLPQGEYAQTGRRQWQNNVKAIRDVLNDLIAGNVSEAMALELLQSLGLNEQRAKTLIADAKDNATIDDPELAAASNGNGKPRQMANVAVPRQGFKVPQAESLLAAGMREFDRLFDQLINAMAHKATKATLDGIRQRIVELEADLRTSARVLGMLSPWQPRVNTYGGGQHTDADRLPVTLANRWRFPWIDDAIAFLTSKDVVTEDEFKRLAEADRVHVFSAPGIDDAGTLRSLQKSLAKSLEIGEDLRAFRTRIEGEVALTRAQTETMYRTETKRGYVAGFDKAMRSPLVEEEFPAVLFSATPDQRVRDHHWDMDGVVVLRSDRPAFRVLRRAADDYNCRCSLTPLSMAEAELRGIKSYADLPSDARAKYG